MKGWMAVLAVALLGSKAATGADALPSMPVNVSGTIIAHPCKINDNQARVIEFGDIVIQSIDGVHYERDVPTDISCEKFTGDLTLTIKGMASGFDENAAASNKSELAIRFTRGGAVVPLNQPNAINKNVPIELKAVPVKDPASMPTAGEFKVNVTLVLGIQ